MFGILSRRHLSLIFWSSFETGAYFDNAKGNIPNIYGLQVCRCVGISVTQYSRGNNAMKEFVKSLDIESRLDPGETFGGHCNAVKMYATTQGDVDFISISGCK